LPETNGVGDSPITSNICILRSQNIVNTVSDLKGDVDYNRSMNDKITKILLGNGGVGLIERVNILALKSQLIDKAVGVFISIISTLITLYLSGVLKI